MHAQYWLVCDESRARRERYLRDDLPVRLGGLAANLRRVSSFAQYTANREVTEGLWEKSKYFIEWTAGEAEVATAVELVELQVQLARWQRNLEHIWIDSAQRQNVSEQFRARSDRVLDLSGLLS